MEQLEHLKELYKKYIDDQISDSERIELYTFFEQANDKAIGELIDAYLYRQHSIPNLSHLDDRTDRVFSRIRAQTQPTRSRLRWLPYAAAATIIGVLGVAWFVLTDTPRTPPDTQRVAADILPGGNRATLTLADGKTITLSEAEAGIVIHNNRITYKDHSKQIARLSPETIGELALTTPNGGIYQVTLPDGSEVWLNAASKLSYPTRFSGAERVVAISGEAYFTVAKHLKPFKIISNQQEIQVLGTGFNVSAYTDELETRTTLIHGSVQIRNAKSGSINRLVPNEQSVVHASITAIQKVDTEPYIAWKNGYFYFKRTPFKEVMRQLARWYNVEVIYKNGIPEETFSGKMGRELTLNAALKLLNVSAVQVDIVDGNKLIVH